MASGTRTEQQLIQILINRIEDGEKQTHICDFKGNLSHSRLVKISIPEGEIPMLITVLSRIMTASGTRHD